MTRRYLLLQPPPFTVTFPKSHHEFVVEPLSGGGDLHGDAVWVLWIRNTEHNGTSSWRPADDVSKERLEGRLYEDGFDVPWPSGAATIIEKAVELGYAKRIL